MKIPLWIGGIVLTLFLLRLVLRFWLRRKNAARIARIETEGEEFTLRVSGSAFDPQYRNAETGAIAARLKATWKHPDTGEEIELSSGWFWYIPKKTPSVDSVREVKVRIIKSDPHDMNSFDLKALGYEPV